MREPEEGELAEFPDGEYTLVYGDEEWLAWTGDAKSQAFQEWLEKIKRTGRMT